MAQATRDDTYLVVQIAQPGQQLLNIDGHESFGKMPAKLFQDVTQRAAFDELSKNK